MGTLKRQSLSETAKAEAYKEQFVDNKFRTIPDGTVLIIGGHDILQHEYKGEMKGSTPVALAYFPKDWKDGKPVENAEPHILYLIALTREHMDYTNKTIQRKGTFNEFVKQFTFSTKGDICKAIDSKIGTKIVAKTLHYYRISKDGEVESTRLNDFDFVD